MKRAILALACGIGLFALGAPASAGPLQDFTFTLTVKVSGKGTVKSNPSGIDCPGECSATYDEDTEVVLTEKPASGWIFVGWEGCSGDFLRPLASAAEETCTVLMDEDRTVTATFRPKPPSTPTLPKFPLTVTVIGAGSVASDPAGIDCGADCGESYPEGTTVTLAPFQNATNFVSWGGDCSGAGLCAVSMTGPRAVTATFVTRTTPRPETQPGGDKVDHGTTGTPFHLQLDFVCYSENEVFLTHLYEDVLERTADPAAFALYLPRLDTGTPPGDVALSVLQSLEYRTMLVRSFYMSFLHRPPSPEELVAGLAALVGGTSDEGLEASLLGSEEYFQTRGGSTQDGFLDALFHDLLGRAPTAGERALFGGASRAQVAAQVLASNEFRTMLIQSSFQMFLGRAPTSAELSSFLAMFGAGASDEAVAAAILGSAEYLGMDSQYHATVDWGDGSTSPGAITRTGDRCMVVAMHTYTEPGTLPIDVDVLAPDGTSTMLMHRLMIGGHGTPPPGRENVQVTGIVLIKVNGKFVPLKGFKQVPLGTELDTTKGKVTLTSPDGSTASFYEGRFVILAGIDNPGSSKQSLRKVVVIVLTGGNFKACSTRTTAGTSVKPKPKGKPVRHAWGNAKGSFRTKGRYASATVRGTLWRTDDFCNGTLITVRRGKIDVFDLVLHKHFLITAGHSYFAPR